MDGHTDITQLRPRSIYFMSYNDLIEKINCDKNKGIIEYEDNMLRLSGSEIPPLRSRSPIPIDTIIEENMHDFHRKIKNRRFEKRV